MGEIQNVLMIGQNKKRSSMQVYDCFVELTKFFISF